ncbi:hypothetical protein D3C80_1564040 [compost metagenome]
MVAANTLVDHLSATPADGGRGQGAGAVAVAAFVGQRATQLRGQGKCLLRPALAGQVVEDAFDEGVVGAVLGHGAF